MGPWPWNFKVKFWKSLIPGMRWPILYWVKRMWVDKQLVCDVELWPHPWPWPGILKKAGSLEKDLSRQEVRPTLWPWAMTVTLDFQGQILKRPYPRNGMADWHTTKRMWVDRQSDLLCGVEFWPLPWIFKSKFLKSYIHVSGMGG